MLRSFESVPAAVSFAVRCPLEVVYSSVDNNFYCCRQSYGKNRSEFHLIWRRCKSQPGSSDFYSEANRFHDFMMECEEAFVDA